jgi:hypothetical protein
MDVITPAGYGPVLSAAGTLVLALLLGAGFGVALERGGLGDGAKLSGQFYLRDLTVFKVMFTAIVTAALGLYWLDFLGLVPLHGLLAPPSYLLPQLVGGVIFGAGFVTAGYCPGTSCVAGLSGRLDGFAALLGMFGGIALFGESAEAVGRVLPAAPSAAPTLPLLLGLPAGVVTGGIALLALGAFALIERLGLGRPS